MRFREFIGNDAVRMRLSGAFEGGRVSHCMLLSGPEGSGKHTLARIIAAAMVCTGGPEIPCGLCPACRKVFSGVHPDVITVDDADHKTVSVELVRRMSADVYIRPNEAGRKVYVIPRAQDLTEPAQNALLKILEEPPAYGTFLLLTTNAGRILPTIRSRCAELALGPVEKHEALAFLKARYPQAKPQELEDAFRRSGGFLGQAMRAMESDDLLPQAAAFAESYAAGDAFGVLQALVPLEKTKREQLIRILGQIRQWIVRSLEARSTPSARTPETDRLLAVRTGSELFAAAAALQTAIEDLELNASTGAVIGWLTAKLR